MWQPFDGVVINQPLDNNIAQGGQLHEGTGSALHLVSVAFLPMAEEPLIVQRDIYLSEYTNSNLHLLNISTAENAIVYAFAENFAESKFITVKALN
ncbi:MAG: hypothetical protein R2825_17765 [Saprospiraceae bacterium]